MANEQVFRLATTYVAARGVKEYRATIPVWVQSDDRVLEIGCEWGTTTALLAQRCHDVLGTDVSADCIGRTVHKGLH